VVVVVVVVVVWWCGGDGVVVWCWCGGGAYRGLLLCGYLASSAANDSLKERIQTHRLPEYLC
jgi:hypothetical protein